ncbi:MICAL3 isoform 8, partial [Pongo abelii]
EEEEYEEEEEEDYDEEEEESSEVPDLPSIRRAAVQAWLETVSGAPLDENDLEEDVDSEPAEIEGEAAEDGDPGDTGAELDDDQHWSDSPSDADRELHLLRPAEGEAEPELRVSEDEEKLPASPKHQERGPSQATSPIRSPRESALLFTPVHSPSTEGPQLPPVPAATQEKSPEERHFPEPLLSKEKP